MNNKEPSRLREMRKQRGLKADQVAEILGIKPSLYWAYERRPEKFKVEKIIILADFFGVSIDYIYNRDKKEKSISGKEIDYIKMIRGFSRENKKLIHQLILMINENELNSKKKSKKE